VNNRGAAFWRNLVITPANEPARIIATDKDTGKVRVGNQCQLRPAAPDDHRCRAPIKDKIIVGASVAIAACATGSRHSTAADRQASLAQAHHPAPGEPGSETWKDTTGTWLHGRRRRLGDRHLRSDQQPIALGHRQSGSNDGSVLASGRQSLYQQRDLLDPDTGKMNWYFQYNAERRMGL